MALVTVNSLTLLILAVILGRSLYNLGCNMTNIESWEIERHEALTERARESGGFIRGRNGGRVRFYPQEFPFDVGIWRNIGLGMGGSSNILNWINPFSRTPPEASGLSYEVNGIDDPYLPWPPPDPDRALAARTPHSPSPRYLPRPPKEETLTPAAFRARQLADLQRRQGPPTVPRASRPLAPERVRGAASSLSMSAYSFAENSSEDEEEGGSPVDQMDASWLHAAPAWRNADGDRLHDFGVDEEEEVQLEELGDGYEDVEGGEGEGEDEDEDVPLGVLLRRRRDAGIWPPPRK
ncbi:MAG: Palmitoyltransferase [Trizodia sp. TS-e1964]|nr:MAG: Palmitoyltransferase [Trizodia sp. TS-e1964]